MGNFFTSSQIFNGEGLDKQQFIDKFCKAMADSGYVVCDSDEGEKAYILRFDVNSKWVAIASEEYAQNSNAAKIDAGRIAKMLGTYCMNTEVIDSDCAAMSLYGKDGKSADMLLMGRYDDYFGDDNPEPNEKIWSQFLSGGSTWEQFNEILGGEYVFVEDGLAQLAPVIGMDSGNLLFSAEDDVDDEMAVLLDFKESQSLITMSHNGKTIDNTSKKLTLNTAFKQIIGKTLEPYGFKAIKGRHPYLVRVINNEILHIITFCPENPEYPEDKAFAIMGGVATIYRKKITLDLSPKQNYIWFNYMFDFYEALTDERDANVLGQLFKSCYYSDKPDSLISVMNIGAENLIKYVLPVMDKIDDIDSCLEYCRAYLKPCNHLMCTEICSYYPEEDEAFLYFVSKYWQNEQPDFLSKFSNDADFHEWVLNEIEKRKKENIGILEAYDLIETQK